MRVPATLRNNSFRKRHQAVTPQPIPMSEASEGTPTKASRHLHIRGPRDQVTRPHPNGAARLPSLVARSLAGVRSAPATCGRALVAMPKSASFKVMQSGCLGARERLRATSHTATAGHRRLHNPPDPPLSPHRPPSNNWGHRWRCHNHPLPRPAIPHVTGTTGTNGRSDREIPELSLQHCAHLLPPLRTRAAQEPGPSGVAACERLRPTQRPTQTEATSPGEDPPRCNLMERAGGRTCLGGALGLEEEVLGLDVAMDHAAGMAVPRHEPPMPGRPSQPSYLHRLPGSIHEAVA